MTPAQKRIALAEACGWKFITTALRPYGLSPDNQTASYESPVPHYLNDLNDLAAARDRLINTPELRIRWSNMLRDVVGWTSTRHNKAGQPLVSDIDLLFASPGQLFEALGLVLKLWPPPPKG